MTFIKNQQLEKEHYYETINDLNVIIKYTNRDINSWEKKIIYLKKRVEEGKNEIKKVNKEKFRLNRYKIETFFFNKSYTPADRLPPPIEEFLTPNHIYNKVKPQPEYNHLDNLYKNLNFLPCEIANMVIYKNKGIMTPTAKLINEGVFKILRKRNDFLKIKRLYVITHGSKKELQEILTNNGIKYKKSWDKKKLLFNYFVNNNDKLTNEGVKEAIQIEITPITIKDKIFTEI